MPQNINLVKIDPTRKKYKISNFKLLQQQEVSDDLGVCVLYLQIA